MTVRNSGGRLSSDGFPVRGASGGGGGKDGGSVQQHTPVTAADNLESTQYALLVDLISEGEIEGLKNGYKSIFINNTPLQNTDNSFNFQNVSVYTRNGTQTQDHIPVTADISNELSVGVVVQKDTPLVRTITNSAVNAARVTITVPTLQYAADNGDINGASVQLKISVQYNGGGFTDVKTDTITGRTGNQYQRDYLINLTGAFPVDIKVTRLTADSTDTRLANTFTWSSYTELTYAKLRYPNSALVAMRVDAEQFSSIPNRSYLIRGIKIAIPSNATVDTETGALIYTGIWNGTFGAAQWCSDPAWVLFDLLTSKRYGFGDHISAAQLDKWSFYTASVYCSALNTRPSGTTNDYNKITGKHGVPNGLGGYEPRFSCNVNIQTADDAYKLINDLASVFRSMPYWSIGSLTVAQDKAADPSFLFTRANTTENGFSYSNSSQKTRPTVAVVSYLNLQTRDTAYEVVEDQTAIAKYGVVTTQVAAFACTSRGQANRLGRWLLYSEQYENEVITFTTSIDAGVMVRPGQIISVADPLRAGFRRGGRISSATTTVITLDDSTDLSMAGAPTLSVILPTGAVETRSVSGMSGNAITVSSPFSVAPNSNSIWTYQTNDLVNSLWRVLSVTEQDGCLYQVAALAYNPSKYAYIENGSALQPLDTSNLNVIPSAPTNLVITEALYKYQSQVRAKVLASWKPVVGINNYEVQWRKDNSNWTITQQPSCDFEILDITPGVFEFKIYAISASLKPSITSLAGSITALGKTAPPADVTSLVYTVDPSLGVTLSWADVDDLDLDTYEIRRGTAWGSATYVTQTKSTSLKIGYLDDGTYTYLVKAIDTSQVYSTNAASVAVTIAGAAATTITQVINGTDLVLTWTQPTVATYAIDYYRVTYGNTYATSTQLTRSQTTSFTVPITWTGSRTFYVAPVDKVGKFTDPPASVTVSVTGAAAPTITTAVGGSTATLSWTAVAGTLPTDGYEIRQGSTFATATVLANITGTSYTLKATWSGTQTFWVVARDANGNYGTQASTTITINPAGAPALSASFAGQNVVFNWAATKGTLDTDFYLLKRGASWAAGTTVATIYSTAYTLKADWGGAATFWLAAVDINGTEGAPVSLAVTVTVPGTPTLTQQVIDNNVLLRWNDVTQTLPIVSYELRKGSTWATAAVIGTKQGGFTTVFETSSGSYTYFLAGIDSAGNYGTPGSVTAQVNQPPDYVLKLNQNSTWTGTKTNIITAETGQLVNVNTTETWQSHFTARSWTTPQDQINAGYPYFLMPSTTTASYEETFDYGTVLAGTKISATLTSSAVAGSTMITPTVSVRQLSTDPWTNYAGLSEVYATAFRYFKIRYDFTSVGGDDLLLLTALNVRLDSKLRNDSGTGTANAGDTGGTTVNFNLAFVDVDSISVTPLTTSAVLAVYDFTDVPNPTSFKVLLFNTSGTRVSGGFSWSARGV
ncbi:MAG: host specificity protein J [Micrococcales bacterium]|nr:host specificity protein J [Micrococcales bacterium]